MIDGVRSLVRRFEPAEQLTTTELEVMSLRRENRELTTYVYVLGGILLLIFLVARR